jgi:predicted HTH transcriptional regulator
MDSQQTLVRLIELGREERFLEYKESVRWDAIKTKLAKTAMGMSNIRDGGTIIIGVSQKKGRFVANGVRNADLSTYDQDEVQAFVNRYAEPFVRLRLQQCDFQSKSFLAIVVSEFDEVPVVCRKSFDTILRQGAVYTRSFRMPETREVQSESEMREILELMTDKAVRRLLDRMKRVGLPIEGAPTTLSEDEFARQLGGL